MANQQAVLSLGDAEKKMLKELIEGVNANRTAIDAIAKQLGTQNGIPSAEVSAAFSTFEETVGKLRNPAIDQVPATSSALAAPRVWTLS